MKTPILGASYLARSTNAAADRMVNLYPEIVPQGGKEPAYLTRAPGMRPVSPLIGGSTVRGLLVVGSYLYSVSGIAFVRFDADFNYENLSASSGISITSGLTPHVSMATNGRQIFIATNPAAYIYDIYTNVFQRITDPDFPGASVVGYLDGYFVFIQPNSQKVWVTSLLDGTSIDALDFASVEGSPDNLVSMIVDHREVWLFGENSVEVWYNSGNADFPLERIQGAFNEIGCGATYSVARLDNGIFWLGSDTRGRGVVYRSNGYTGQRISTHAVEWRIQQYATLSDAVAYTYQQDGHAFYVLNFPSADATWVYDVSTGQWHERACVRSTVATVFPVLGRHLSTCQATFGNNVIVGDAFGGAWLSRLDLNAYNDEVVTTQFRPQICIRAWRALATGENTLVRTIHDSLQLDCEVGVGLITGQGSNPQVALRWSDDGGHTWSSEHWRSLGAIGTTQTRVFWRRLGMTMKSRDRVYEITVSDPVQLAIMGAELHLRVTNA